MIGAALAGFLRRWADRLDPPPLAQVIPFRPRAVPAPPPTPPGTWGPP